MDATWPWLLDLFGGRQSARSIHFIAAGLLVALHRRPPGDGGAGRPDQRDPLDDHRPLPPAEGEDADAAPPHPPRAARAAPASPPRRSLLGGCDWLGASPSFRDIVLGSGEWLSYRVAAADRLRRRSPASSTPPRCRRASAPTATPSRARRTTSATPTTGFADWRLPVDGLVETPARCRSPSCARMPARSQITRHDCVEGWSAIGKWTGVPLGQLLDAARLQPRGALHRLPLRRRLPRHRPTTRASTSSTPSTRRRSSPTA